MRGRGWRIAGTVFAVLVIASGTASAASWLGRRTEVQDQEYRRPLRQLVIDAASGDITLIPGGPGVAVHRHLTWSWGKPTIREVWSGSTLHITAGCPVISIGPRCAVDYTVHLPADASVVAHTSTGDITATGLRGDLRLSTSTGGVSGTVLFSPNVQATTSTGDVSLWFSTPPDSVRATGKTGGITVTVPAADGYRVTSGTHTGDVRVQVRQDPTSTRSIEARTSTGDIHIGYG